MLKYFVLFCFCLAALSSVESSSHVCHHKGKSYAINTIFKDGCKSCTCFTGGFVMCSDCVKKDCFINGKKYKYGETFQIDCNTCTCDIRGIPVCTEIHCIHE